MTLEELKAKLAEIDGELNEIIAQIDADPGEDEDPDERTAELDALEKRSGELTEERENIAKQIAERQAEIDAEKRAAEEAAKSRKIIDSGKEDKTMSNAEVRKSQEYIEAFAKYIKTGKDEECRALLTENVSGTVPVPEMVEERIRNAWENDEVFSRVTKTFVPGNLKVGFEISATDAVIHTEGGDPITEENLVLGIVTMVPKTIKKMIKFSTEVAAMSANGFLEYVYDELTYKIVQKAADSVIAAIVGAPAASDATHVGVAKISGAVSTETIFDAEAALGDVARDRVFIASGATIAAVKKSALAANYGYDPFDGLTVIQNDTVTGAIVGDLAGVQANMPEGESVRFIYDELSLAEADLVKLVGRLYAAIEVVQPKSFAVIAGE